MNHGQILTVPPVSIVPPLVRHYNLDSPSKTRPLKEGVYRRVLCTMFSWHDDIYTSSVNAYTGFGYMISDGAYWNIHCAPWTTDFNVKVQGYLFCELDSANDTFSHTHTYSIYIHTSLSLLHTHLLNGVQWWPIHRQRMCCYRLSVTHTHKWTHIPGHCWNFRTCEFFCTIYNWDALSLPLSSLSC